MTLDIPPPIKWNEVLGAAGTASRESVDSIRRPLFEFIRKEYGVVLDGAPLCPAIYETFVDKEYTIHPEFCPRAGDVVVDAGAQFGDYSLLSLSMGADVVYAFEPHPEIASAFDKILKLNAHFHGIVNVCNYALGDAPMHAVFPAIQSSVFSYQDGRIADPLTSQSEPDPDDISKYANKICEEGFIVLNFIKTQMRPLDHLDISASIIKIDVEGFEVKILMGAKETIRKHHPKIIIEIHSNELEAGCMSLLEEFGYTLKHKSSPHPILFLS